MSDASILHEMLELTRVATNAEYIECVVQDDTQCVVDVFSSPDGRPRLEDGTAESWAKSRVTLPVTGPSAETGWLTVAHSVADAFSGETTNHLERAARLIEDRLDRQAEQTQLADLGRQLRSKQDRLRVARDQLEVSNRELEQFAYIAAHELLAPLQAVAVYAEILETITPTSADNAAEAVLNCANEIRAGMQRMTQQVHHLLTLSRTHLDATSTEPVNVETVVRAALDAVAEPLASVDAAVEVGTLPTVMATAVPLQSVFANLISNAIRYRSATRPLTVSITSSTTEAGHRIVVADNGEGIAIEDHTRVFEMFERASETEAGSGIGLALSRRILEVFDATIGLDADPNQGSTFFIDFPHVDVHQSPGSGQSLEPQDLPDARS